jgi:hypothetical protein
MNQRPDDILQTLRRLEGATSPSGAVLSVYLDTSLERTPGQAYLIAFRDGCRAVRATLPPEKVRPFDAAVAQAERFLVHSFESGPPGLALFASGDEAYFFAQPLPVSPENQVVWNERPFLEPIRTLLDDFERVAVVLFDKERTRLYTLYLGAIETKQEFTDPVPGKQKEGGWAAGSEGRFAPHAGALPPGRPGWGTGWAQSRIDRHHGEHVRQHTKRTVEALRALQRERPFQRVFVAGPDEAVSLLRQELPGPSGPVIAGTFKIEMFADDNAVLQAALQAAEAAERAAEEREVNELFDRLTAGSVVGVEDTLAALSEGRAYRLFLSDTFQRDGALCRTCGRLVTNVERCPRCGQTVEPVEDLRERVTEQALAQRAVIEVVTGAAAERLNEAGGIGAWTRW